MYCCCFTLKAFHWQTSGRLNCEALKGSAALFVTNISKYQSLLGLHGKIWMFFYTFCQRISLESKLFRGKRVRPSSCHQDITFYPAILLYWVPFMLLRCHEFWSWLLIVWHGMDVSTIGKFRMCVGRLVPQVWADERALTWCCCWLTLWRKIGPHCFRGP